MYIDGRRGRNPIVVGVQLLLECVLFQALACFGTHATFTYPWTQGRTQAGKIVFQIEQATADATHEGSNADAELVWVQYVPWAWASSTSNGM